MSIINPISRNENCSKCKSGMMEELGFLKLSTSEVFVGLNQESKSGVMVYCCSVDECGYTELKTVPGTLSQAKRLMRQQLYEQYAEPDTNSRLS